MLQEVDVISKRHSAGKYSIYSNGKSGNTSNPRVWDGRELLDFPISL